MKKIFKEGEYVIANIGGIALKCRVTYCKRDCFLQQDCYGTTFGDNVINYGHERVLRIGTNNEQVKINITTYQIRKVSKRYWDSFSEYIENIGGFPFKKGRGKDSSVSFGCGEVKHRLSEIRDFIDNREKWTELEDNIASLDKKIKALTETREKISDEFVKFRDAHRGCYSVVLSLTKRYIPAKSIRKERLEEAFFKK